MVLNKIDYGWEIHLFYCRRKERSVAKGDKIDASDRRLRSDELATCPSALCSSVLGYNHRWTQRLGMHYSAGFRSVGEPAFAGFPAPRAVHRAMWSYPLCSLLVAVFTAAALPAVGRRHKPLLSIMSFSAARCRQGFGRRTRLVQAAAESTQSIQAQQDIWLRWSTLYATLPVISRLRWSVMTMLFKSEIYDD